MARVIDIRPYLPFDNPIRREKEQADAVLAMGVFSATMASTTAYILPRVYETISRIPHEIMTELLR